MASQNQATGSRFSYPSGGVPVDLVGAALLVLLADAAVLLPGLRATPLRVFLGLPFLLFVPGYLLLAVLFPGLPKDRPEGTSRTVSTWSREEYSIRSYREEGIDGVERAALSFALSLVLLPMFALVLTVAWRIDLVPIVASLSVYAVVALLVAAVRRARTPEHNRFTVRAWLADVRARFFAGSRTDVLLNAFVALALLLAASSAAYAVAAPSQGGSFTDFAILAENEDGELVADVDEYPDQFVRGEAQQLAAYVENGEKRTTDYTIIVEVHRVRGEGESMTVVERQELRRMTVTLEPGQTWTAKHDVAPEMVGEDLRLTYLLYKGEPPADPTTENAYRRTHLWIDVTD